MAKIEQIGGGAEKLAVALDEQRVRLFLKNRTQSDRSVQSVFLLQSIASLIFPDQVPPATGWGRTETKTPYVDVERIPLDAIHRAEQIRKGYAPPDENKDQHEVDYYRARYESIDGHRARFELGKKLQDAGFALDTSTVNFSHAEGKTRFLDFGPAWHSYSKSKTVLMFEPRKLKDAIASITDAARREKAEQHFNELLSILPKEVKTSVAL